MNPVDNILKLNTGTSPLANVNAKPVVDKAEGMRRLPEPGTISDITDCSRLSGLLKLTPSAAGADGLQELVKPGSEEAKVLDAVKQFESIFLRYLASAMNKAMPGSEDDMPGGQYYQGLIDTKLGEMLAQEQGLGLGEAMLRQLGHEPGGANDDA